MSNIVTKTEVSCTTCKHVLYSQNTHYRACAKGELDYPNQIKLGCGSFERKATTGAR